MGHRRKAWTSVQAYNSSSFSSDKNNTNGKRKCESEQTPQNPQTIQGSVDNDEIFHLL